MYKKSCPFIFIASRYIHKMDKTFWTLAIGSRSQFHKYTYKHIENNKAIFTKKQIGSGKKHRQTF